MGFLFAPCCAVWGRLGHGPSPVQRSLALLPVLIGMLMAGFALPAQILQLFTILTQISERDVLAAILDPTLLGEVVWNAYVASYAVAYGRTLWVMVGMALIGATAVWIGLRRSNIRFTAEEVAVDLNTLVFEDVSDSF